MIKTMTTIGPTNNRVVSTPVLTPTISPVVPPAVRSYNGNSIYYSNLILRCSG